jgi:signal transduction histidine kinase
VKKTILFALFSSILTGLLIYFLYSTELHDRLELFLFDTRTVLKPQVLNESRVATVHIGDKELSYFTTLDSSTLPIPALIEILDAVAASQAEAIALLLPHQDFDYEKPNLNPVIEWIYKHKNSYLGIFDYHQIEPSKLQIPPQFKPIVLRVAGAGTLRRYRQGVVREAPLLSYLGEELVPQLTTLLARRFGPLETQELLESTIHAELKDYRDRLRETRNNYEDIEPPGVLINYWKPDSFVSLSAQELVHKKQSPLLYKKIVLIAYTAFRQREINFQEGTFVNTPWEGENNSEVHGTPLLYVTACILDNLLTGSWLQNSSLIWTLLQTIFFSLLSFFIWRMAPSLAVFLFVLAFTCLFYIHGIVFSYMNTLIPIADTFIFSVLAAIIGAFWRAQEDARKRALRMHRVRMQRELALVQGRFLNRFAFELYDMNQQIEKALSPHQSAFPKNSTLQSTFHKAIASSAELNDYLSGIKHYSLLTQKNQEDVKKKRVALKPVLNRILSQFESLIEDKNLRIIVDQELYCDVWSDEVLLEPIIFNLISNAIKYSPKESNVHIRISGHRKNFVVIHVRDHGCGIPKEHHERIFERFYRVPDDNSHHIKGNGLGLYLVRYFSEKIGTKIRLWSELGVGSQFSLFIEKYRQKRNS